MKNKIIEAKKIVQLPPKMLGLDLNLGPTYNLKFHQHPPFKFMSKSVSPP